MSTNRKANGMFGLLAKDHLASRCKYSLLSLCRQWFGRRRSVENTPQNSRQDIEVFSHHLHYLWKPQRKDRKCSGVSLRSRALVFKFCSGGAWSSWNILRDTWMSGMILLMSAYPLWPLFPFSHRRVWSMSYDLFRVQTGQESSPVPL